MLNTKSGTAPIRPNEIERLRHLVAQHDVSCRIWPERLKTDGQDGQVAYEVDLCGEAVKGATRLCSGCAQCRKAYDDLKQIAHWMLSEANGDFYHDILPFDQALHIASGSDHPEIILEVRIESGTAPRRIKDGLLESFVLNLQKRLAVLGVHGHAGKW
jgi:hypothetical protein